MTVKYISSEIILEKMVLFRLSPWLQRSSYHLKIFACIYSGLIKCVQASVYVCVCVFIFNMLSWMCQTEPHVMWQQRKSFH